MNIKKYYSNKTLHAARQDEIYKEMDGIVKTEHDKDNMEELAYVRRNELIGEAYNIYINSSWPAAMDTLRLHEYGHIFFGHFRHTIQKKHDIEDAVKEHWNEIKHHFDESVSCDEAASWLGLRLNNILMDFEVNSKLLTEDEYHTFSDIVDDLLLNQMEKKAASKKDAEKIIGEESLKAVEEAKKKDPNAHIGQMCWPTNYQFPVGLDYEAYVSLAINHLDRFINNMKSNMSAQEQSQMKGKSGKISKGQTGQGSGQGQSSQNGNGSGQGQGSGKGQNSSGNSKGNGQSGQGNSKGNNQNGGGNGKFDTSSTKDNGGNGGKDGMIDKSSANGENGQNGNNSGSGQEDGEGDDGRQITSKVIKGEKKGSFEVANDGDENDMTTGSHSGDTYHDPNIVREGDLNDSDGGDGWTRQGFSAVPVPVSIGRQIDDLSDFIEKHAFAKAKTFTVRDQMYNWNRRKTTSNVIIPKNRTIEHYTMANVVVIVDTSGSVSEKSVEDTLASIEKMRSNFDKRKSHIISWDTALVEDSPFGEMHVDYSGGGTDISRGIDYAREKGYLKKENDKLFVISDFCDNLPDWKEALDKVKCDKFGICTMRFGNDNSDKDIQYEAASNGINRVGFKEILAYTYSNNN